SPARRGTLRPPLPSRGSRWPPLLILGGRVSRFKRIDSIVEAVGNTPLVRLRNIERSTPGVKIYLKLEYTNPGGSVKDRPALQMITDAIADGRLTKDKILVDATSGNTGVALSLFGACLGYRIALVMP